MTLSNLSFLNDLHASGLSPLRGLQTILKVCGAPCQSPKGAPEGARLDARGLLAEVTDITVILPHALISSVTLFSDAPSARGHGELGTSP